MVDKNNQPLISVVIPTYNSGEYITKTLESVFAQTYRNYEVIVSDDGSKDNTAKTVQSVLKRFHEVKSELLLNDHQGPGAARNTGIKQAKGEWVAFLDSDDCWFAEKLEEVVHFINNNKDVDLICHSEKWIDGTKEVLLNYNDIYNHHKTDNLFLTTYRRNFLSTSAVTVRRGMLVDVELFDETLPSAQDYDLWLRLSKTAKIGFIEKPLGSYITRPGNITSNVEKRVECLIKISRKHYEYLKQVTRFPYLEKTKYEGMVYSSAGLSLLRKKQPAKGLFYFFIGLIKWPFRFDLISKGIKRFS